GHRLLHGGAVAHVQPYRVDGLLAQFLAESVQALGAAGGRHDAGPVGGEAAGDGGAGPGAGPGDEDGRLMVVAHGVIVPFSAVWWAAASPISASRRGVTSSGRSRLGRWAAPCTTARRAPGTRSQMSSASGRGVKGSSVPATTRVGTATLRSEGR